METQKEGNQKKNSKHRVKAAIRVRPMIARELAMKDTSSLSLQSDNEIIINESRYSFDKVFGENSTQSEVYLECVKDLVVNCFEGYNAAILAYGQTGSGKTFTMGTASTIMDFPESKGIIPRVINDIFLQINQRSNQTDFSVKVSFLEIYNEQIIDLLSDSIKSTKNKDSGITIRQQKDGSVSINGAVQETVSDAEEMTQLLQRGGLHRTTAATLMNEASSRSHSIFTIVIQQHTKQNLKNNDDENSYITAKFVFVDLAGSQRIKKTGATGVTLKEGININLGLLELGNVISALATINKKEEQFITYRNSKLTRILQDSLGGNSNTYIIACISPSDSNIEESLNTIKYASKAMNIKNKPVINRDHHSTVVAQLKQKITELELQNRKIRQLMSDSGLRNVQETLNQSKDLTSEELKRMKHMFISLQKKTELLNIELREEKRKKNEYQISNYQIKRQRDIFRIMLEEIQLMEPTLVKDYQNKKINILDQYLGKIQNLQNQLFDKQKINNQLQEQYEKLRKTSEKDEYLLLQKNKTIYQLSKQNKKMKEELNEVKNTIPSEINQISTDICHNQFQEVSEIIEEEQEQQIINKDNQYVEKSVSFAKLHSETENELKNVDKYICEKEQFLKEMAANQIQLEYQLIAEMKEQYHQKINLLEKQKFNLMNKQKDDIPGTDKNKFKNKIDNLENQLKQFRRKIKEQNNMQKIVNNQNQKLKELSTEIKTFKVQKIELSRKLKEDKDNFQKFKSEKIKVIIKSKRQNIQKDAQIKRLTFQNKKNLQIVNKRQQQLKKAKRINQTLKNISKHHKPKFNQSLTPLQIQEKQYDNIIQYSLKNILYEIDRNLEIEKYEVKMKDIQKQLHQLLNEQSLVRIKLERHKLQNQIYQNDQRFDNQEKLNINLYDLKERIANSQQNFEFCQKKHQEILNTMNQYYDLDIQILYNQSFANFQAQRNLLKSLFKSMKSVLGENYKLREIIQKCQIQINSLKSALAEQKQQMVMLTCEHQANITKMRQQLLVKSFEDSQSDSYQNQVGAIKTTNNRWDEREKKDYERKILDLTKINRQTTAEVQMWRRKCNIIEEKYRSIRNLLNKDKFIGRPFREEDTQISQKDKKMPFSSQFLPGRGTLNLQESNTISQNMNNPPNRLKRNLSYEEGVELVQRIQFDYNSLNQQKTQFDKNKWQCLFKMDAHTSPILSLANYSNFLITAGTKSVKIWDLETQKNVTQITNLPGLVRNVIVNPQRKILITACDKNIAIWDLQTLKMENVLKFHKDEVRALHSLNNYLFSGGKGLPNSGSLLVWDFKNLTSPIEEKERNQDIFTITSHKDILYFGTRNHQIRKMKIQSMEILPPFEPPHMDTVTGLATMGNYLISGSKDKNLRLWSLENPINNIKFTIHAFNDYINTVARDQNLPIFYSGAKDGQIKIGGIKNQKIELIGVITSHTQSVNAICSIQDSNRGHLATVSSDKTVRLWQPTTDTLNQIQTYQN